MLPTFWWTTFDVSGMFPSQWKNDVREVADEADFRHFPRTPVISREAANVDHIPRGRVHADQVENDLPWLPKLYRSGFLDLAQRVAGSQVARAAQDGRYGVVLNVQRGPDMRFECHVDSNSLTALLFFTDHGPGAGGELVIGHDSDASSMDEIDESCSVIRPQAGHMILFDGRRNPHYVRPLTSETDVRIVAVMNYYTDQGPESTRPPELNRHLYGDELYGSGHAGGGDGGTGQDGVALVEDGGLAGGDATGRFGQGDVKVVVFHAGDAGVDHAVGAELDGALAGLLQGIAAAPHRRRGGDVADLEVGGRADRDRAGHRLDGEDVAGVAVGGGVVEVEAAALADGEGVGAVVMTDGLAGGVDDGARGLAQVVGQEALGVAVGDEADVVRIRLVGDGEAAGAGLLADLGLGDVAEGEHGVGQLVAGQDGQDVGLVLARVDAADEFAVVDAGVVAGADGVEAQSHRPVEDGGELDLLVAADAGVGGAAGRVLGHEVFDDVGVEAFGHVPDVERDADHVGGAAGIAGVLQRAAAAGAGAVGAGVGGQREVDRGHVMTRVHGPRGGRGRINAAGQGGQHS
jgi:hypothetical protein